MHTWKQPCPVTVTVRMGRQGTKGGACRRFQAASSWVGWEVTASPRRGCKCQLDRVLASQVGGGLWCPPRLLPHPHTQLLAHR